MITRSIDRTRVDPSIRLEGHPRFHSKSGASPPPTSKPCLLPPCPSTPPRRQSMRKHCRGSGSVIYVCHAHLLRRAPRPSAGKPPCFADSPPSSGSRCLPNRSSFLGMCSRTCRDHTTHQRNAPGPVVRQSGGRVSLGRKRNQRGNRLPSRRPRGGCIRMGVRVLPQDPARSERQQRAQQNLRALPLTLQ